MDEAASRLHLKSFTVSDKDKELEKELEALEQEKEDALAEDRLEDAIQISDEQKKLEKKLARRKKKQAEANICNNDYEVKAVIDKQE